MSVTQDRYHSAVVYACCIIALLRSDVVEKLDLVTLYERCLCHGRWTSQLCVEDKADAMFLFFFFNLRVFIKE